MDRTTHWVDPSAARGPRSGRVGRAKVDEAASRLADEARDPDSPVRALVESFDRDASARETATEVMADPDIAGRAHAMGRELALSGLGRATALVHLASSLAQHPWTWDFLDQLAVLDTAIDLLVGLEVPDTQDPDGNGPATITVALAIHHDLLDDARRRFAQTIEAHPPATGTTRPEPDDIALLVLLTVVGRPPARQRDPAPAHRSAPALGW